MIDLERQDALIESAMANLMAAHAAINEVSKMHWGSDRTIENLLNRIGIIHNEVASYGQPPQE